MAIQELSKFYSDDGRRTATIMRLLDSKQFQVSVTSDSGSSFNCRFETLLDAENFAEDWVLPQ